MHTDKIKPQRGGPLGENKILGCNTTFGFSTSHIMFVVLRVIITEQCNKVWIVGFVGCKVELTTSLATFLHTAVDEVFKQCFLVVTEYSNQIGIVLHIIFVIIDSNILIYGSQERLFL